MSRQIVLDTETTGLDPRSGHRIIEVGCIELRSRRPTGSKFHRYLNPDRAIDAGAQAVHGLSTEFLADKPRFAEVADDLLNFLRGAELLIHNADFDVGFLNAELAKIGRAETIEQICTVTDTVMMARRLHPGQRVNLDALCKRYSVDNSNRDLHGALLDARLLADVYLAMTSGQDALSFDSGSATSKQDTGPADVAPLRVGTLKVIRADAAELVAHRERLQQIGKKSNGKCLWIEDPA